MITNIILCQSADFIFPQNSAYLPYNVSVLTNFTNFHCTKQFLTLMSPFLIVSVKKFAEKGLSSRQVWTTLRITAEC